MSLGRRSFINISLLVTGGLFLPLSDLFSNSKKRKPVSPPGSLGYDHLLSKCTACQLCIRSCSTGVLRPADMEYGLSGMMMPLLDYQKAFCRDYCHDCGNACPTGAISKIGIEIKRKTRIGNVLINNNNCEGCADCIEKCPKSAIQLKKSNKNEVFIDTNLCIGCGVCENMCSKVFYIEGLFKHEIINVKH